MLRPKVLNLESFHFFLIIIVHIKCSMKITELVTSYDLALWQNGTVKTKEVVIAVQKLLL